MSDLDALSPVSPKNPVNQTMSGGTGDDGGGTGNTAVGGEWIEGAESIPLPSKGVFYTWKPDYWNMETLQVRQLNYTDEDILTTRQYFENGTVFNELLKNVIVDKNKFPATGLVPIDRDTILLWLRTNAFGKDFEITYTCPGCGQPNAVIWDISTFEVPTYSPEVYEELKNNGEYEIVTPFSKMKLKIVVPTIGKAAETEKKMQAKKTAQKTTVDFFGTASLMLIVSAVEVDGRFVRDKTLIEQHFKKAGLSLSDARWIRKQAELINLKYDTKKDVICTSCNHVSEGVEMPIVHPNFFWPDSGI